MKLVEHRLSIVSECGPDDDKFGNNADLRCYEESDATSYVTDNTGEHFSAQPIDHELPKNCWSKSTEVMLKIETSTGTLGAWRWRLCLGCYVLHIGYWVLLLGVM